MSAMINSENYEAFYLDYLEGNLNEADTASLLLFLQEHPEFCLDDDSLPELTPSEFYADPKFVNQLRVFDEQEKLSVDNAEQFMIASIEGVLAQPKQVELESFLALHPDFKPDYALYQLTRLQADSTLIYPSKSGLKQTPVFTIFWRSVSVAASFIGIIALSYWLQDTESRVSASGYISASFNPQKIVLTNKANTNASIKEDHINVLPTNQNTTVMASSGISYLPLRALSAISSNQSSREIIPLNLSYKASPIQDVPENTAFVSLTDMKNPIKPLTEGIKKRFNRDIDLRTAKASKTKQGGFYLKIGRFEISRKTAPVDAILAVN